MKNVRSQCTPMIYICRPAGVSSGCSSHVPLAQLRLGLCSSSDGVLVWLPASQPASQPQPESSPSSASSATQQPASHAASQLQLASPIEPATQPAAATEPAT